MNNLKQYASLLNDAAPKGEFLAYINEDEAEMLKDNGALGLLTPQGIPSYFSALYGGGAGDRGGNPRASKAENIDAGRTDSGNTGEGENANSNYNTRNRFEQQARQRAAKVAAEQKAAKDQDDARLDYLTTEYLDVELSPERKKEFEQYRTGVRESINPSTKTSNKVVGGLLSNFLFPGAGTLYNAYLDATAMGYKLQNPFKGIIGSGGEISVEDVNNLRDGGGGDNARSQLIQNVAKIINPNLPDSQVNNYFKNIGSNSSGVSPAYMTTYNQAKDQVSKSLNLTPNNQQFGYEANPYSNYSMSMTSANPFFDELTNQGLI